MMKDKLKGIFGGDADDNDTLTGEDEYYTT